MGKTQKIVGLILLLLACGLAAYAWLLSSRMTTAQKAAQPRMTPVVVAQARIPAGSVIAPEMLKVTPFPSRPAGAYADAGSVVGKTAEIDIAAGEPVLQERLGGGLRPMLQHIAPNQRAVALRVDEVIAVGNRLAPGDWVDVFAILRQNNGEIAQTQSRLVLPGLQVLAFGSKDVGGGKAGQQETGSASVRPTGETPKTAVLAVKTEDVDRLILAEESGRVMLALRPQSAQQPPAMPAVARGLVSPAGMQAQPGAMTLAIADASAYGKPLTLKQLVADAAPGPVQAASGRRHGTAGTAGDSVIVMHGLKAHQERVLATGGERQ